MDSNSSCKSMMTCSRTSSNVLLRYSLSPPSSLCTLARYVEAFFKNSMLHKDSSILTPTLRSGQGRKGFLPCPHFSRIKGHIFEGYGFLSKNRWKLHSEGDSSLFSRSSAELLWEKHASFSQCPAMATFISVARIGLALRHPIWSDKCGKHKTDVHQTGGN